MTSCSIARENICAYIDNELVINIRNSFEDHIKGCKECKNELNEMIQIVSLCTNLPQKELPMDFKAELHEKLLAVADRRESNVRSIRKSKSFLFTKTFASIAAGLLLIFLAGSFYKYGFFSSIQSKNSANSYSIAAEQPAAARMEENGMSSDINKKADNSADAGIMAKSFSAPAEAESGSLEVDRSAAPQNREISLAGAVQMLDTETAKSMFSTIVITSEDPQLQVEKVRTLAMENSGDMAEKSAYSIAGAIAQSADQDMSLKASTTGETAGDPIQTELIFIIPDAQYTQFLADLTTAFGAADVQSGALVTEDLSEVLNSLFTKSNEIDIQIQESQKDSSKKTGELDKLKVEKENIDSQIESIRLGNDFVNVTVRINKK